MKTKKRKEELKQEIASEDATSKVREDYIQFTKGGVSNGSIKSVIPDSDASSRTGKNAEDYERTGKKTPKEFQSAFREVKRATNIVKYPYEVREESKRVDIIPSTKDDLMSMGKYTTEIFKS